MSNFGDIGSLIRALEFYAEPSTYHDSMSKIAQDCGSLARIALGRPATPDYTKLAVRVGNTVAAIETALDDKDIVVGTIDNYAFLNTAILLKNVKPEYMREAKRIAREVAHKLLPEFNVYVFAESTDVCICPDSCDCQNPEGKESRGISNACPVHNLNPYPDPSCKAETHNGGQS